MDKYKLSARVIVIVIVVLIVLTGIVYHEVPIHGKDINEIYRENTGKIWLITGVGTIVFSLLMYYVLRNTQMLQSFMLMIDNKNDIIKSQSDQIIATLEHNAKRHDELMVKINENTASDIIRDKKIIDIENRLDSHDRLLKMHDKDINELKK